MFILSRQHVGEEMSAIFELRSFFDFRPELLEAKSV